MSLKNVFFSFLLLVLLFSNYSYSQKYDAVDAIVDGYSNDLSNADDLIKLVK